MKWISIKDRLPNDVQHVLVYYIKPDNSDLGWASSCYPVALAFYDSDRKNWFDPFDNDWLEEPDYWCAIEDIPKPGLDICNETVCIHFKEKILEISFELKDKE